VKAEGETTLIDCPVEQIHFDTRMMVGEPGFGVFLALNGATRSGADYIHAAVSKGVRVVWTSAPIPPPPGILFLRGHNPLDELITLARYRRSRLNGTRFVGVTGSNGKTIVKEWIHELTGECGFVCPRSYNSALGVALSLLAVPDDAPWAVLEAGISHPGDMDPLFDMIRPHIGVMTRFGEAHAENFLSDDQRLAEKCKLFSDAEWVVVLKSQVELVARYVPRHKIIVADPDGYRRLGEPKTFSYAQLADRENAALAYATAQLLVGDAVGEPDDLPPVSMRREIIADHPEIYLINDSYTSDPTSVAAAFAALENVSGYEKKIVILSDLSMGDENAALARQKEILERAICLFGAENVRTVGPRYIAVGAALDCSPDRPLAKHYPDSQTLVSYFEPAQYKNAAVLLKGSRLYPLEELIPYLTLRAGATYLRVDLDALTHNYRKLKAHFGGKLMAMVKAGAYGAGAVPTARALESAGADAFGVAHTREGVELRLAGIRAPVMVMNPAGAPFEQLVDYRLQAAVGSFDVLHRLDAFARKNKVRPEIHVEFDTGMGRLGFFPHELDKVLDALRHSVLVPVSVFTHLAAADDPRHDDFTRRQIHEFETVWAAFQEIYSAIDGHACNSAGIMRFKTGNMARAGIALYGIGNELRPVAELKTVVLQTRRLPAGATVGYSRAQTLKRDTLVATVPIGYADGVPRRAGLGNVAFSVAGKPCPTLGHVCMDLTMLDATDADVRPGDEVDVFSGSLENFARCVGAIPYEILSQIPTRVRRVFVHE
jgi:alanine racemase